MAQAMVARFGCRPRDLQFRLADFHEAQRLYYERRYIERAAERGGRMMAACREQQARRDGYRPAA